MRTGQQQYQLACCKSVQLRAAAASFITTRHTRENGFACWKAAVLVQPQASRIGAHEQLLTTKGKQNGMAYTHGVHING